MTDSEIDAIRKRAKAPSLRGPNCDRDREDIRALLAEIARLKEASSRVPPSTAACGLCDEITPAVTYLCARHAKASAPGPTVSDVVKVQTGMVMVPREIYVLERTVEEAAAELRGNWPGWDYDPAQSPQCAKLERALDALARARDKKS